MAGVQSGVDTQPGTRQRPVGAVITFLVVWRLRETAHEPLP